MKAVYWRPHKVSRVELSVIAIVSVLLFAGVEQLKVTEEQPYLSTKLEAAELAAQAIEVLRAARLGLAIEIDATVDPAQSGLLGEAMSPVTSDVGSLIAKQTSVNPNFAAVVVHYLKQVGVMPGDVVAIGCSGSFPAVNVAVYAAVTAIGARPIVISSVAGSQWGANEPRFMWPDMERVLREKRVFDIRSEAASRGGVEDRALGISREGRGLIDQAIERNGLTALKPENYQQSVEARMRLYAEKANGPIKAYVNVGGGTTSVGTKVGKDLFLPGVNRTSPRGLPVDSVMSRFVNDGVPVIHLVKLKRIALENGLPVAPASAQRVGQGGIYYRERPNRVLALLAVLVIALLLLAFIRRDFGARLFRRRLGQDTGPAAEPMV